LVDLTQQWHDDRLIAARQDLFVPAAPDPVRFLKHRRWEDRLMPESSRASLAELPPGDVERLAEEHLEHGGDRRWLEYQEAVLAGLRKAGSWNEWQGRITGA
jgi:hypothetical protein